MFIGDVPTWDPQPTYTGELALCPGQPETLDLNADFTIDDYTDYTWSVNCVTQEGEDTLVTFEWGNVVDALGDMFPPTCWGYPLTLTASIANPCLGLGLQHDYSVVVDDCEILPVNVFTPRDGNDENNAFIIVGLEPWEDDAEGVLVRIFNRWGNLVYETRYRATVPGMAMTLPMGVFLHHFVAQWRRANGTSTFSVLLRKASVAKVKTSFVQNADTPSPVGGSAHSANLGTHFKESVGPVSQRPRVGADGP